MHMGLSDVATADRDGRPCNGSPRFPWALVLAPTAAATDVGRTSKGVGEAGARFLAALTSEAGPGSTPLVLYDVFAAASPHACEGPAAAADPVSGLLRVGRLMLRSRFLRTTADETLFFWHQLKEEDYAIRPEWAAAHGEHQRLACGADSFSRLIAAGHFTEI